jgi:3-oxoadipate enol-lactonase
VVTDGHRERPDRTPRHVRARPCGAARSRRLGEGSRCRLFDGWQRGAGVCGGVSQRTAALGLIDTTAWYGADAAAKFKERADAARSKGLHGLIDFQLTRWFSDGFRVNHPEVLTRTTDVFVANDVDCYAASCELLGAADTRAQLASFNMPTAIVVGEEDYATPVAMARQLHDAIPHSTLTIIPAARHLTPIEFPEHITTELRGLFGRL